MPAEWVTVRRIRIKDAVEYVWWLSKTPWPKANNRAVLKPYSKDNGAAEQTRVTAQRALPGTTLSRVLARLNRVDRSAQYREEETPTTILKLGNNAANDLYTERCKIAA